MDRWSNLYILDRASGRQLARLSFRGSSVPLVNQETDRLYLASPTGLVQCLHEVGLESPIRYEPPPPPEGAEADETDEATPTPPTAPAAAAEDPFAAPAESDPFATEPE
jgi:hypothetical protein